MSNVVLLISILFFAGSLVFMVIAISACRKYRKYFIETAIENHEQNENLRKLSYPINTDGEMNPLYFANIPDTESDINLRFAKKRRKNAY